MNRIPILRIGDVLLVSIQVELEDQTATQLLEDRRRRRCFRRWSRLSR